MNDNIINLIKDVSKGPCTCMYGNASAGISWDETGKAAFSYNQGPRTHHCLRCRAREALDADGIPYEKDDRIQYEPWMMKQMKVTCATPPYAYTTTLTGSIVLV